MEISPSSQSALRSVYSIILIKMCECSMAHSERKLNTGPWHMIPYQRNKQFIGRSQSYTWLIEQREINKENSNCNHQRMALYGMGGVG